jgi:hypothetical protein
MRTFSLSLFAALSLVVTACSSPNASLTWSNAATEPAPSHEADAGGVEPSAAHPSSNGAESPTYPAPHAPMPLVDYNGGPLLTSPRIVTVTVAGDPMQDRLAQFGDVITQTTWWERVSDGYCAEPAGKPCIGPGAGGGHVILPSLPGTSFDDGVDAMGSSSIKQLIRARIADGAFPAPTPQTLYVLYMPAGVSVTLDAYKSCQAGGFYGYHNVLALTGDGGAPAPVYYAVVARCSSSEAQATRTASHEIIEAATDPNVADAPAYYMNDALWSLGGGEVGDVCVDYTGNDSDTVQESSFTVQRSWSNKEAKAGGDPCVPAPIGQAYFNVAPAAGSDKIALAVGESKTIELDGFSDGPAASWTVDVTDFAHLTGDTPYLRTRYDSALVNNGSKVNLTLTLVKATPPGTSAPYAIISRAPKAVHVWFGEVVGR